MLNRIVLPLEYLGTRQELYEDENTDFDMDMDTVPYQELIFRTKDLIQYIHVSVFIAKNEDGENNIWIAGDRPYVNQVTGKSYDVDEHFFIDTIISEENNQELALISYMDLSKDIDKEVLEFLANNNLMIPRNQQGNVKTL